MHYLQSQLAVSHFDILVCGVLRHAQGGVVGGLVILCVVFVTI
jgi:hypothetical protein